MYWNPQQERAILFILHDVRRSQTVTPEHMKRLAEATQQDPLEQLEDMINMTVPPGQQRHGMQQMLVQFRQVLKGVQRMN